MSAVYVCTDPKEREEGIKTAAQAAREGELVVLPTDTVYGIGADAFHRAAPRRVLGAKRRGPDMPLPVLVANSEMARGLALVLPGAAQELMDAFWPGALTLVIRSSPTLNWDLGDTDGTVAVRAPNHSVALDLIKEVGPMAVSSANLSGQPAATTINQARVYFDDMVEVYLDAGKCEDSTPSTIVDLTPETPRLLRQGVLGLETLRKVMPEITS